eukprot:GILJ01009326.1.p1 GENE.GILJ01009326.1~~GILJ01009326.1.p1  ORF type:complete len:580 (-),score=87.44 GILJ01009326.1:309-2048(-)
MENNTVYQNLVPNSQVSPVTYEHPSLEESFQQKKRMRFVVAGAGIFMVATFALCVALMIQNHELARHVHNMQLNTERTLSSLAYDAHKAQKSSRHTELAFFNSQLYKFAVPLSSPVKNQQRRGTCWDFATVAYLEQTYRQQGVEAGYLRPEEYLYMSEQAYGVMVIEACHANPTLCNAVGGSDLLLNTTESGYEIWVKYFKVVHDKIVPESVCYYYPTPGNDTVCPELALALPSNPLKFTLNRMKTLYDSNEIKRQMIRRNRTLLWSSKVNNAVYYLPAEDSNVCESPLVHCPTDKTYGTRCCQAINSPGYSMEGEFEMHGPLTVSGGHAMLMVGFNDMFRTRNGHTGGFILKNSWGSEMSHSLAYWMQEISDYDEAAICPNSKFPLNWEQCTLPFNEKENAKDENGCTTLTCKSAVCEQGSKVAFVNITMSNMDGIWDACFARYRDTDGHKVRSEFCVSQPMGVIARMFAPHNPKPNNDSLCGFYFFPYDLAHASQTTLGGHWAIDFDLTWHKQSYMANAHLYPELDYSHVNASSGIQTTPFFEGPIPFFDVDIDPSDGKTRTYRHSKKRLLQLNDEL